MEDLFSVEIFTNYSVIRVRLRYVCMYACIRAIKGGYKGVILMLWVICMDGRWGLYHLLYISIVVLCCAVYDWIRDECCVYIYICLYICLGMSLYTPGYYIGLSILYIYI